MGIPRKKMKFFGFPLVLTAIKSDPCVIPPIFRDALDNGCESLDLDQIVSCGKTCEEEMNKCIDSCVMFDQQCLLKCIEPDYEICAKNCPCIETKTKYNCSNNDIVNLATASTNISSLSTTTSTTTTATITTTASTFDDIMYNTSTNSLTAQGFKRYLIVAHSESNIGFRNYLPNEAKEIFVGCGPSATINDYIQLGAAMMPNELFAEKNDQLRDRPVRNFYTYDRVGRRKFSSESPDPRPRTFGFRGHETQCFEIQCLRSLMKQELSVYEESSHGGLYRCGLYKNIGGTVYTPGIGSIRYKTMTDFSLVMYYR